jgi:hypothetical protein
MSSAAAVLSVPADPPVLSPEQALALDARYLAGLVAEPSRRPQRWSAPAFARQVGLVRVHLAPIRSRASLAASFGREAFHASRPTSAGAAMSPVRIAYALRWLELDE